MDFNGPPLRVIRNFHNHTQRDLGNLVAISAARISQFESGTKEPTDEEIRALAEVLQVEPEYFGRQIDDEFSDQECSFRRLADAPERLRRKVLAHGTLFSIWVRYLKKRIRFPKFDVPEIEAKTPEEIERAADQCRERWGLGFGPIQKVTRVLENAGIVVTTMDAKTGKVDAFSRYGLVNVVALNTAMGSSSRLVYDCAHELGHAVLHRNCPNKTREQKEAEANRFAAAFLLPMRTFPREFWGSHGDLLEIKKRWGVSLQAISRRAFQLGMIGLAEYRRSQKRFSKLGFRSGAQEPAEPEPVVPELLDIAAKSFREKSGKNPDAMAADLGWTPALFYQVTGIADGEVDTTTTTSLEDYRARRLASM